MRELVRPQEISRFPTHPGEIESKAFKINIIGKPLFRFHVNPESYTLVWKGKLQFSRIDQEVLQDLAQRVHRNIDRSKAWPHPTSAANVSFIIGRESSELLQFDLGNTADHSTYRRLLQYPDQIAFARYDVLDEVSWEPIEYSFTSENFRMYDHGSELAIKLPRSRSWSKGIIDWVLEHHTDNVFIERALGRGKPERLLRVLNSWSASEQTVGGGNVSFQ